MEDVIYYGGPIITMEQEGERPEAVCVSGGLIAACGPLERMREAYPHAALRDLRGQTLLPAFIDPHSHITALAGTLDLVPLADCGSFGQVAERLREHREKHHLSDGDWVVGFGYDHNNFEEKQHPDKAVLDRALPHNPVLITHASGHMGVFNSQGLAQAGVDAGTPDPQGGRVGREPGDREPNGYMEEKAFIKYSACSPAPAPDRYLDMLAEAQNIYASYGITTAQEGIARTGEMAMLKAAADQGKLKLDIVAYLDLNQCPELMEQYAPYTGDYLDHLRVGGWKIFLDGSPQGRTAWMSQPYEGGEPEYRGYPVYPDEEVERMVETALKGDRQILAHCNGDAASAQFIGAYAAARRATGLDLDIRPVMIHAQLTRKDQLEEMAGLGMIPSFFVAHVYHWGDVHIRNFGMARASAISAAAEAVKLDMPFTFHQDTPVIRPDMMETLWCAACRRTRDGALLGGDQRIPVYEALKAVTSYAAYQYFEEDRKGTITPGKLADLVLLSQNPLECPPDRLRDIKVNETIKAGQTIYRRDA